MFNEAGHLGYAEEGDDRFPRYKGATPVRVRLQPGDILLVISAFDIAMTKPRDFVPAEYFRINFDAIRIAIFGGLTVIDYPSRAGLASVGHRLFSRSES